MPLQVSLVGEPLRTQSALEVFSQTRSMHSFDVGPQSRFAAKALPTSLHGTDKGALVCTVLMLSRVGGRRETLPAYSAEVKDFVLSKHRWSRELGGAQIACQPMSSARVFFHLIRRVKVMTTGAALEVCGHSREAQVAGRGEGEPRNGRRERQAELAYERIRLAQ